MQSQLAERKADLVAYARVLADIDKCIQGGMPPLRAEQLAVVIELQDKARRNCEELAARVVAAEIAAESIRAPETSDAAETISA
jgi:hypothetical protein